MSLAGKLASKLNKLSHGTSRLIVRDSYRYAASTMIGFIALVASLCSVSDTYATSSSITITLDDNIVDLNVAPTANGAFSKSSASKIGVATTNYTGYTLSISASGDSNNGSNSPTALINGDKSLSSIETAITEEQFKALDSTAYNNMWGYLPSKYNSKTNTSFLPSPSTNGDMLDITITANTTVNEYEITLGARVDTTASLGSYSNVFLVDVVANAIPYTIIFDDNVVGSMPTDINDETTGATVTLPNNVPVRDGYTFLGWCTVVPTNTNGIDACTGGTTYSTSGTLTLNQEGGANDYHLYAMWQAKSFDVAFSNAGKTKSGGYYTMQDMNATICNNVAIGQTTMLYDTRDNEAYTVGKLKDSRCWMLDNLRLGSNDYAIDLTPGDTNIATNWTLPQGITSGFGGSSGYTTAQINAEYKNNTITNYGIGSGKRGVYYNYCAASAGTYCYAEDTSIGNANYDICPTGWRIPTGSSNGEYNILSTYYDTTQVASNPNSLQHVLSIPFAGSFTGNETVSLGNYGGLWASNYNTGSRMGCVDATTTYIDPANSSLRTVGKSIRCIANN